MNERNAEKIDCVDDIFDCEIPVVDCPIKRENELLLIQKKEACEAWEVWARSLIQERDAAREEGTRLREALEQIASSVCGLAVSHMTGCHRKHIALQTLEGSTD